MRKIAEIFSNLNTWRHIPTYQLERRVDAFISAYLPGCIQSASFYASKTLPAIVPEFPLKKNEGTAAIFGRSDYAIFHPDKPVYFLELKTDTGSVDQEEQVDYLRAAEGRKFSFYFDAIFNYYARIPNAPDSWLQYQNLLELMRRYSICTRGEKITPNAHRSNYYLTDMYKEKICKVIYFVPNRTDVDSKRLGFNPEVIDFKQFCDYLGQEQFKDDFLAKTLRYCLARWATIPPGSPLPN